MSPHAEVVKCFPGAIIGGPMSHPSDGATSFTTRLMLKTRYLSLLALPSVVSAQDATPDPASAQRDTVTLPAASGPLRPGFRWRSIGPVGQGGRVDDIAVAERNTSTYCVGFAPAGIW